MQIGGPTGAFIVIIYGIIQQHGLAGLLIATIMAGILLIMMGLFKLGNIIKFVPYPVIVGFTAGIAVTIFSTQMNDLFGMQLENIPADFVQKWIYGWLKNGWVNSNKEPVKNKELWQELYDLTKVHDVEFIKVKGHADNEYNNRCDELARNAIKLLN